ncbi:MAG: DUF655 domain-containing protein [Candidatus Altiarchaeota archaeon]|nr:DUF655 domain-containing protein [Candidatus Altiarchaeota archaeon]
MKKDDNARILDYLPRGKSDVPPHKRKPIAQAVGEKYYSLLEISPKRDVMLSTGDRVYIGESTRDKVESIERRIKYEWLTPTAKSELPDVLEKIVIENEPQYVSFFNTAGTISTRQHKLELLPKIGKRHRQEILDERDAEPFKSFEDMRVRLKSVPDPVNVIVDKIVEELKGESKYYLFVPLVEEFRHK